MSGTIRRGKIIRADLANYDGRVATYSRLDSTGGTTTGLPVGNEVDVLQVFGSGTSRSVATITAALNYIGSLSATLIFAPGTWTIDSDLTIGSNFTCHIPAGCVFAVSNGKTLTFSGPIQRESATWYSGTGSVAYTATNNVLMHWADRLALSLPLLSANNTFTGANTFYETLNSINAQKSVATYESGSFTGTLNGCLTSPTASFRYTRVGNLMCVSCAAGLDATSNSTSMTITGVPTVVSPSSIHKNGFCKVIDNGTTQLGEFHVISQASGGGVIQFYVGAAGSNFTNPGTKGLPTYTTFVYDLT